MSSSSQQQHSRHHKSTGKGAYQAGNRAAGDASAPASVTPTRPTSASTTPFQTIRFRTEPPSRPPSSAASAAPNEQQHQQAKQSRQQSNVKPRLIAPQIPSVQPAPLLPSQSVPTSSAPSLRRRSVPIPTSAAYIYVGANQHYAVPSDSQASTPGATTGPAAKKGLQPIVPDLITANARTSAQQLQQLEFFRPQVDYRGPVVLAASPPASAAAAAARNASYAVPAVLPQHTHNTRGRRTSNDVASASAASAADATVVRQMTFVTESGQQKLLAAGIRPTSRMLPQPQHAGPTELAQRAKLSAAQPAAGAVDKNGEPCRAEPAAAAAIVPRAASSPPDHRETKAGSSAAQTPLRSPSMQQQRPAAPSALLVLPTPAATPNTSTPVSPAPAATPTAPTQTTTTTTTTSTAAVTSSRARSISKTSPSLPWAPTLPPAILQSRNPISRDEFMKVLDAHVAAEKAAAAAAASAAAMTSNGTIVLASALPPTHHIKPAPPALTIEQPNPAALAVLGKRKWEDFAAAHEAYLVGQREAAAAASVAAKPALVGSPAVVDKKKDEEARRNAREAEEAAALQLRAPLMEGMPKAREGEATEVFAERLRVWTEGVARRIIQDATTLLHAHSTTLQTRLLSTYRAHGNAAATLASLHAMLDAERAEHARLVEENARAPLLAARAGQLETALVDAVVGRVAKKPKATETTTTTPMDVDQKEEDPQHELVVLQRQVREAEARCSTLEGARQRIGAAAAATSPTAEGTNGLGPAGKLLARLLSGGSAAAARATAGDAVMSLLASENGIEELMEALDMV
ncbi:hypothetical protein HDU88_008687 [Geranomyces variabilis]|nr:hypothetical protein HDU88_008687 [Geranomyces variabilis]